MTPLPEDLERLVLHRDANLLILDKPAGIPVHRGPSGKPSLEDRLGELTFGLRHLPALAHRLDHDTSGCLVLARHPKALSRLGRLFGAGKVRKTYWAIAGGALDGVSGTIDLALARHSDRSGWRILADPAGQPAVTERRRLGGAPGRLWLELHPLTGRTHQIRVHLAALGCPILGDPAYGAAGSAGPMLLHAWRIEIPYWEGRPPVVVLAPPPAPFQAALDRIEAECFA